MTFPASAIGHGGMGLRSGLLTLDELVETAASQKRALIDLRVGRLIAVSWTAIGSAYRASGVTETFDGVNLDVAEVVTSAGENLTRVLSQPEVGATAGAFFYNQTTNNLFIHLADGSDPNNLAGVEVVFGKYFGSLGTVEPRLGRSVLANGDFEVWSGPSTPTSWTGVNTVAEGSGSSGVVLKQDSANVLSGTYSCRMLANLFTVSYGGVEQAYAVSAGPHNFIVGGYYMTSTDMPSGGEARLVVKVAAAAYMDSNGLDTTTTDTGMLLNPTYGEWKRFIFACKVPSTATTVTTRLLMYNSSGSTISTGTVNYDSVWTMPVYHYEYVEPRLPMSGLPPVEVDTQGTVLGEESIGLGQIRLINGDHPDPTVTNGYFETYFSDRDAIGRQCQVLSYGAFESGEEMTLDAAHSTYSGTVQDLACSDMDASLSIQDTHSMLSDALPPQTVANLYTAAGGASANDLGRPMPIVIGGLHTGIKAPRIGLGATNRLPILLFNDPTWGLGTNICGQIQMYAYTDQDAADRQDTVRRTVCEFTTDQLTGQVSLFSNPGPFEVLGDGTSADVVREVKPNDTLDFVDNVTTRAGALTPGIYTCTTLAAHAQTVMNAFGGGTFTVSYNNSGANAHKFEFSKTAGAGIFSLLLNTGVNKHRSAYPLFGFSQNTDQTGAATYDSAAALYDETRADEFHLRLDGTGYRDDTNGTYTGITGGGDTALIYQPPDVLRFILGKICRRPSWELSDSSLTAFRSTGLNTQAIYLGGLGDRRQMTVQQVVDLIANGALADAVIDGAGRWLWKPRATSSGQLAAQAVKAPTLVDRDFLTGSFVSSKDGAELAGGVSVIYGENNSSGDPLTRDTSNALVSLRHNRGGVGEVRAALFETSDAQFRAWDNMLMRVLPRRKCTFSTKVKLLRKTVGDLIKIQRTRMLPAELTGMLNSDVFRIMSIRLDPQTFLLNVIAYTADLPRALDFPTLKNIKGAWSPVLWNAPQPPPIQAPWSWARRW